MNSAGMVSDLQNWKKYKMILMDLSSIRYMIKTAGKNDIAAHLFGCKDNFIPPLDSTVDIPKYAEKIAENAITFEAWHNNELAGMIAAYFNDQKNQTGFITNVSTLNNFSGKGIASKLLENCISYAKEKNFKEIKLEVNGHNRHAIKLYEKYDFRQTASAGDLKIFILNLQHY